jgi:AraC family transcriptional regulator
MDSRQNYLRAQYASRINRVYDHIQANLDKELTLAELADVARFSPYHFHRLFHAMVGETLNAFIQRLRVEKAAAMLLQNPGESITDIAFFCGFSGSSVFARAFREAFGRSASQWRASGSKQKRQFRQRERQPG